MGRWIQENERIVLRYLFVVCFLFVNLKLPHGCLKVVWWGGQGHFWKMSKRKQPFFTGRLPLAENIREISREHAVISLFFYISCPV